MKNAWLRRAAAAAWLLAAAWGTAQAQKAPAAELFVQTGHSLQVTAARLSPDGGRIAVCDGFGSVIAWDAASGRQYREVYRHTGLCMGLAFTPDGQSVLSSGGARSGQDVVMARWTDGQVQQVWRGHKGLVMDVVPMLDSKGAWSLGESDGILQWQVGREQPLRTISTLLLPADEDAQKAPSNVAMAMMPTDHRFAYVARSDGSILRVDLRGRLSPMPIAKRAPNPAAIAVSPDGQVLAVVHGLIMGSTDHDVTLLDAMTGQELRKLTGHEGNIRALAFSGDGKLLASAAQLDINVMLAGGAIGKIREHESLRIWEVASGRLLGEARNQRNEIGTPFLHGSVAFSGPGQSGQRLILAMWDEAARVFELDAAHAPKLVHSLEGRGLAPRQLQASDAAGRLLVTDGRPRIKRPEVALTAQSARLEFADAEGWTPAREKRLAEMYALKWPSSLQRAAMWNLQTGKMERMVDWQRGVPADVGLDAQGRFVSLAPLFPSTTLVSPFRSRLAREATVDAEGQVSLRHFGYEPWDGPPGELFLPLPGEAAPPAPARTPAAHEGAFASEVATLSPTQRWAAIAGVPVGQRKEGEAPREPRIFVMERGADGKRAHRLDLPAPGIVRALAIAADERTLWAAGTASGLPADSGHEAWLMAIDLATGQVQRRWSLPRGVTVDRLAAHPAGNLVLTNGDSRLAVWDKSQDAVKHRINASQDQRGIKAMALSGDGRTVATADNAGYTVMWDWADPSAAPVQRWARVLAAPSPHLLAFANGVGRLMAGAEDGSVRLLSSGDGNEIARMVRFDNDEWITIIPEGYFVASQEGDRWVNVRMDGKVYGIDQFYDVFYRPDIVERRLAGEPIEPLITVTLEDAIRRPPPQVALQLPQGAGAAGQKMKVALSVKNAGGGVGEVRVLHNGKLVEVLNRAVVRTGLAAVPPPAQASAQPQPAQGAEAVTRALRLAVQSEQSQAAAPTAPINELSTEVELELVPGENAISVIGFNGPGNLNARPVTRAVQATGSAVPPRIFVLAVGVDIFTNANAAPPLQFAVKDTNDFTAALRARVSTIYKDAPVIVRTLHNEQATIPALNAALDQLQKEVRPSDILVWFVASHGTLDARAQYGIVLYDWDGKASEASLFSTRSILEAARRIRAFNQLVILDTCHAGGISSLVRGLYDARLAVLARNMGLHMFASASATEEALDGYQGNGLFTSSLLKAMKTPAADRNADRQVTINELGDYARRETMRVARLLRHNQEPLLMSFGKDVTVYAID
jgi:WD40 repeat protein